MAKTATFTCNGCGVLVERTEKNLRRNGRFCTARCYYASKTKHKSRVCRECGNTFENRNALRYCSRECFMAYSAKRKTVKCRQCGKEFTRPRPANTTFLCGRDCVAIYLRKPSEVKNCRQCGAAMTIRPMGKRTKNFCGKECWRLFNRGEQNRLFRGNRRHYRGANWGDQARLARTRDANICQGCSIPATSLEKVSVDHIVPFRMTAIYGKAEGKDPNDLRNLLSLCRSCHARKTMAERRLLKGDLIGFRDAVKCFLPMDKVNSALAFWGFI